MNFLLITTPKYNLQSSKYIMESIISISFKKMLEFDTPSQIKNKNNQ